MTPLTEKQDMKPRKEESPEILKAKAQGYDEAIDMMCNELRKQIEMLHKAARDTKRVDFHDNFKYGVKLYKALIEQLKLAKGNPQYQKFDNSEVKELVDHLTGSVLNNNRSIMTYFDNVLHGYMAGTLELKKFTFPPDENKTETT
jgi:hypothetical protein